MTPDGLLDTTHLDGQEDLCWIQIGAQLASDPAYWNNTAPNFLCFQYW